MLELIVIGVFCLVTFGMRYFLLILGILAGDKDAVHELGNLCEDLPPDNPLSEGIFGPRYK